MSDVPDYELPDQVIAETPEQIRAIAEPTRARILDLVLERAATVTELAEALDRPKSSVAYHVAALVRTGLLRTVRTRKVRAIEEHFYGRTGRTIVMAQGVLPKGAGDHFVGEAARELAPGAEPLATLRHARINENEMEAFFDRVVELAEDFTRLPRRGDTVVGFIAALYPTNHPTLPTPREPPS